LVVLLQEPLLLVVLPDCVAACRVSLGAAAAFGCVVVLCLFVERLAGVDGEGRLCGCPNCLSMALLIASWRVFGFVGMEAAESAFSVAFMAANALFRSMFLQVDILSVCSVRASFTRCGMSRLEKRPARYMFLQF
jgi:hypothetical protein